MVCETDVSVHQLIIVITGGADVWTAAVGAAVYVTADTLASSSLSQTESIVALKTVVCKCASLAVCHVACCGKCCEG